MRRLLFISILAASLVTSCSYKKRIKYLSATEFDHYYALRVFMDEGQQKTYLKLETEEERNAWLKKVELWDTFYQYDEHIRERIVAGDVQAGWTKDMMYMAWGAPFDSNRLPGRAAERSFLYLYRFEQAQDNSVMVWVPGSKTQYKAQRLFIREVTVDDDVITDIKEKDAHW